MIYTAEEIKKLKCYVIQFWFGGEEGVIKVTPEQAAKVKLAIKSGLNYFEIGEDLYMIKEVKRVIKDKRYIEDMGIENQLETPDLKVLLDSSYYLKDQKLLKP